MKQKRWDELTPGGGCCVSKGFERRSAGNTEEVEEEMELTEGGTARLFF